MSPQASRDVTDKRRSPDTSPPGSASVSPAFEDETLAPLLDAVWDDQAWREIEGDAAKLTRRFHRAVDTKPTPARVDRPEAARRPHLIWPAGLEVRENAAARTFANGKTGLVAGACFLLASGVVWTIGESFGLQTVRIGGLAATLLSQLLLVMSGLAMGMGAWRSQRVLQERITRLDHAVAEFRSSTEPTTGPSRDAPGGRDAETLRLLDSLRRRLSA